MNKRDFLKSILAIGIAPQVLLPKAPDAFRWHWKKTQSEILWMPNPDYKKARFEIQWFIEKDQPLGAPCPTKLTPVIITVGDPQPPPMRLFREEYPLRFQEMPRPGEPLTDSVPPFIPVKKS